MTDKDENKTFPTLDSATASVTMDVKKIPETGKQLPSTEKNTAQSIVNTKQIIIDKPFSMDIDITDETPLDEIPISHSRYVKAKWRAEAQTEKDLKAALEIISVNPDAEQFLFNEIHRTVSHLDDHIINIVFHAALSTYFKPLNLALKAESGSGKTYSTIQSISFLPDEDIVTLSYISPKVLVHSNGIRKVDVDGKAVNFDEIAQPIKPERDDEPDYLIYQRLMSVYRENVKKYRELEKQIYYEVDLRNKIYVMMEGIDQKTFTMLKTTMSRDNEEHGFNDSIYVDDKGRNHKTRLVGSPVMIFNSVDSGEYNNEFATRCLTATPNTSPEKIRRAMEISNHKASYPWEYEKERFNRRLLKEYIRKIRNTIKEGKINVANPFPEAHEIFSQEQTRAMRDFNKYQELIAPFAIFKIYQRPIVIIQEKRYLIPTVQDAIDAKASFDSILQTTQTGTEQRIISFYWETVAKNPNSTAEQLTDIYNMERKRPVSTNTIRAYLKRLTGIEWVDERESEHENTKGYIDKRFKIYTPLKKSLNASNLNFEIDLRVFLENSFKKWLKTLTEKNLLYPQIIIPRIDGTALQISLEEVENIILGIEAPKLLQGEHQDFSEAISKPNLGLNQENYSEIASKSEIETNDQNSKNLFFCRLPPNKQRPCDGEGIGGQCPLLAEYEMLSSNDPIKPCYCETHFKLTRMTCAGNGFRLIERQTIEPKEAP